MNPEPLAVCQSRILCFTAALAFSPISHAGSVAPADVSVPGDVTVLKLTVPKELQGAKGPQKVNGGLTILYDEYQTWKAGTAGRAPGAVPAFQSKNKFVTVVDGYVVIDAAASGDPEQLRADLERLGLKNGAVYGRMVSGRIPITVLKQMDALGSLKFARPAYMKLNTGTVNSEGDAAMRSDDARTLFGVDGTGIMVGTLSDSYNCNAGAVGGVASNDLPAGVVVLSEGPCPATDEGRAMMELIHDVAPGASQAFHTAFNGQADFARGIIELMNLGAKVVNDDVIYFAEPMFQDGIVAQAVDKVVARGVSYFSPAGNDARQSYTSPFRASGRLFDFGFGPCEAHDFKSGAAVDVRQHITLPLAETVFPVFQWDQPFFSVSGAPGAGSDLDILLVDEAVTTVCAGSAAGNVGADPVELFSYVDTQNRLCAGDTGFNLMIFRCRGPSPGRIKYVDFGGQATIDQFNTRSGTTYGHANARGAEAVGAADYQQTPEFGTAPPVIEAFSSAGGTPIRLNTRGGRLSRSQLRKKPGIVAPDGTNTTFFSSDRGDVPDGLPNFFGTSAAAPHAAAVAALLLEQNPTFYPNAVYTRLRDTALDMDDPLTTAFDTGFDFRTGYGLIDAAAALAFVDPNVPGVCRGLTATITGSPLSDIIVGTGGPDVIVGFSGNDNIRGAQNADTICGGRGNDNVSGGRGRDRIFGEAGRDRLNGGTGRDRLDGGAGRDRLNGGSGRDRCIGGPGTDTAISCERVSRVP